MQRKSGNTIALALLLCVPVCATVLLAAPRGAWAQSGKKADTSSLDALVPIEDDTLKPADAVEAPAKDAGAGEAAPKEKEAAAPAGPEKKFVLAHPSASGFAGLLHTVSGDSGEPWSWAVGIHAGFFVKDGFIHKGDENRYVEGVATVRYTLWKYFEAAVALTSYANYNKYSNDQFEPTLFQTLGDASIGVRGFYPATSWLSLGLAYKVTLLNSVGKVGVGAASHELLLPITFDLKKYDSKIPLRLHVNAGYLFDESGKLVRDEENARGESEGVPCKSDADGNYSPLACVSPVERFGLGINRTDFFTASLALEFPVPYVGPFVELGFAIPVNRQGFNCGQNINESDDFQDDYCLQQKGFSAFPNSLTIGLRIRELPHKAVKGLGILLAADIGLTGMDRKNRVRELAMNPPYMIYFGLSFTPSGAAKEVVKVQEVVKTEIKEAPPKPRVAGRVLDADTKAPVAGAVVRFAGLDMTGLVAKDDGTFLSYPLEKGEYEMALTAAGYFDATCAVTLEETGDTEAECVMRPMPKLATLSGRIVDAEGGGPLAGASVALSGPVPRSLASDTAGEFTVETEAGVYEIKAELDGYFAKIQKLEATAGGSASIEVVLSKKPKKSLVVIKKQKIVIGKKIQFEFNSAIIKPESYVILDSVADLLMNHPEISSVEIQGHTDDKGSADYNLKLSQDRADSVRDYLIGAGVEPHRLSAKGFGKNKPVAPNVTAAGREKNRRVEFLIVSQGDND